MRTRRLLATGLALLLSLIAQGTRCQEISLDVTEQTLKNGMKLLIVPKRNSFTFAA